MSSVGRRSCDRATVTATTDDAGKTGDRDKFFVSYPRPSYYHQLAGRRGGVLLRVSCIAHARQPKPLDGIRMCVNYSEFIRVRLYYFITAPGGQGWWTPTTPPYHQLAGRRGGDRGGVVVNTNWWAAAARRSSLCGHRSPIMMQPKPPDGRISRMCVLSPTQSSSRDLRGVRLLY